MQCVLYYLLVCVCICVYVGVFASVSMHVCMHVCVRGTTHSYVVATISRLLKITGLF